MKKICLFDVNETLLDLRVLDPEFEKIFGNPAVRKEWFGQFIQSALVSVVTNSYQPFGIIGSAAFDMVAERHSITVTEADKKALLSKITQLPAHPEVAENLARLKQNGHILAALTNSTYEVAGKQLENSWKTLKLSNFLTKFCLLKWSILSNRQKRYTKWPRVHLKLRQKTHDLSLRTRGILPAP